MVHVLFSSTTGAECLQRAHPKDALPPARAVLQNEHQIMLLSFLRSFYSFSTHLENTGPPLGGRPLPSASGTPPPQPWGPQAVPSLAHPSHSVALNELLFPQDTPSPSLGKAQLPPRHLTTPWKVHADLELRAPCQPHHGSIMSPPLEGDWFSSENLPVAP